MARILIELKFTLLRNTSAGLRIAGRTAGVLLVAGTWAGALLADDAAARASLLTLAFAMWGVGAALGPVLMSGSGVLRPDYFALLPLPGRALGRGLLASVFASVAAVCVLLAFLAGIVHAVDLDPIASVLVVVGAPLCWVLVICASRLVYGLLGAAMRSRFGIEIAGLQFGIMFATMFTGWMIVQVAAESVPGLFRDGLPEGAITTVLDAFPTSWPLLAVERAADGEWLVALGLLAALAVIDVVLLAVTVGFLTPRTEPSVRPRGGRARSTALIAGGGLLPATPLGAVAGKELRQWNRDPWRALEVRSSVWTGISIGTFALLSGDYAPLAGFSGLIVALMLSVGGCNLYGQDGTAVWQNVVGERAGSVRHDVYGRQLAMALIFLPQALLISAAFVVLSGAYWVVPILAAALPAALGVASGAAMLVSALGVSPGVDPRLRQGPNDANGNIALHVWISMIVLAVGSAPTVAIVVWAAVSGAGWLVPAAVAVGIANGCLAAWGLGRVTISFLEHRMPDVFSRIRYGQIFRDAAGDRSPDGVLGWVESTTLKGEQQLTAQRQKERSDRLEKAGRS